MTTSESVLTVIGELRGIITDKETLVNQLTCQRNDLIEENEQLRRELMFLRNSIRDLSESLMKDTTEAVRS